MKNATVLATLCMLVLGNAALADNRASQVLTESIASKILGGPVEASSGNSIPDTEIGKVFVSRAHYKEKSGKKRTVGILIRHANSIEEAESTFAESKQKYNGVEVKAIGDKAYRTAQPPQLDVLKGQNWLIIDCGTLSEPDTAGQEAVAKEILPKVTF